MLPRQTLYCLLCWFLGPLSLFGSDLQLQISSPKRLYKFGEQIEFDITFRNISTEPIRVLPEIWLFSTELLSVRKHSGVAKLEHLRPHIERNLDLNTLARYVVLLNPNDSLTRHYVAKLVSSLPPEYEDNRKGLYLLFPTAAIKLGDFRRYDVGAEYDSMVDQPVGDTPIEDPKLWRGKVHSPPITLEFRSK
jgi:hypothetical protein